MKPKVVRDVLDASIQLLQLRKTTVEKDKEPGGQKIYRVDGEDYTEEKYIALANSICPQTWGRGL